MRLNSTSISKIYDAFMRLPFFILPDSFKNSYPVDGTRPFRRFNLRVFCAMLLAACLSLTVKAQNNWIGATGTDWATAANWSTSLVPAATDDVIIPATANQPEITTPDALAKTVEVQTGAVLTIQSTGILAVNGSKTTSYYSTITAFFNNGTVQNNGILLIGNVSSVGDIGLFNLATFNNNTGGQISIDRSKGDGLLNNGTFTNVAAITIGAAANVGIWGVENYGTFENNTGGQISANRSTIGGFGNRDGVCTNAAAITIGDVASVGTNGLVNYATFSNNTGGQISIDHTTDYGLYNNNSFTNAATITIGAVASVGTNGIYNVNTFNNNTGGQISIDRSTSIGLDHRYGTFTNAGTITIGAAAGVGTYGLENFATFNNSGCAVLALSAALNNSGSITNAGLFTVNTNQPHSNTALTNNGVISYPQGNAIPNVTNNALIASPIMGFDMLTPALDKSGSNPFTIGTTWYSDTNLITAAGTYSELTNTFSPSGLTLGNTYTLYFGVTRDACTQTVPIKVTIVSIENTWYGTTNTDWNTATNWSMGQVPTGLDDVVIPASATNQPILSTPGAVAQTVEVQNGATLTIQSNGTLAVNGSKSINGLTTAFYNNGTVENSGHLLIGNLSSVGQFGLRNFASFNNNTGGQISIDRSATGSLENDGGTFTNFATIIIGGAASVGPYGIYNKAMFNNMGGQISIDNSTFVALTNDGGIVTNAATLTIGAVAGVGVRGIYNIATFNNNPGGQISIDNSTGIGLYSPGTFTNYATITIGAVASVGDYGLINISTFNNSGCAVLTLLAPFYNSSSFTNGGLFTVNTAGAHYNIALLNEGIISYPQGNPIPNVTNNKLIALPISTTCGPVTPALQLGTGNNLVVGTTWYQNAGLSTVAGSYTPNTFNPTNLAARGPYAVYFSVSDPVNSCARTVSIPVTVNGTPSAWYKDADGDGYSDGTTITACNRPTGYKLASELTATSGDCNDSNGAINPNTKWYKDADNDGYSDGTMLTQCTRPTGYKLTSELTAISGDCKDTNASINPGAAEICGNGIDDNCNGQIDEGCSGCKVTATVSSGTISCYGGLTTITVKAKGGTAPYQYMLNGGPTSQVFNTFIVGAGTYSITVKDKKGCIKIISGIVITQPVPLTLTLVQSTDVTCRNGSNGKIVVSAGGGTGAYSYKLNSGSYRSSGTFQNLKAGTYTITAKDAKGCYQLLSVVIKNGTASCSSLTAYQGKQIGWYLDAKLMPNPAEYEFTLNLEGNSSEAVNIRVVDVYGRTVHQLKGTASQMYKFGQRFAAGVYIIEIIQGEHIKTLKAVKN